MSEHYAMLFPDGSMSVHAPDTDEETARRWCREEDPHERDPARRPKLVRVEVTILTRIQVTLPLGTEGAGVLAAAKLLHPDAQHALAAALAANVGYCLTPEEPAGP